jgi:hypothetical protein
VNVCPAIVTVPDREAPVLAATASVTVPEPVPEAPFDTVIHGTFGCAVHPQPSPAVTATFTVPPPPPTVWPVGAIEYVQVVPACEMPNAWSPTAIAVWRTAIDGFGATLNSTRPGPFPLAPAPIVTQSDELAAVHWQPAAVATAIEPLPPSAPNDPDDGSSANVHDDMASDCDTVTA